MWHAPEKLQGGMEPPAKKSAPKTIYVYKSGTKQAWCRCSSARVVLVLFMGFLQILYDVLHRGRGLRDEQSPSPGFPRVKQRVPGYSLRTPNTREFESSSSRIRDEYWQKILYSRATGSFLKGVRLKCHCNVYALLTTLQCSFSMSWFCDNRACISLGGGIGTGITGCAGCRRVERTV